MNKKEKAFLENNLYTDALRCLRTDAALKNDKSKKSRIMANAAKVALAEAEYIGKYFRLDVEGIKAIAKETFELQKG